MGYRKKYRKSGRKNYSNRNNYFRYEKPYEVKRVERPQSEDAYTFDATQYKKKNITIKDMNGNEFILSGNLSGQFAMDLMQNYETIRDFDKFKDDISQYPKIWQVMKEMVLSLLNQNVEGKTYTMEVVNAGFNDIDVLQGVIDFAMRIINQNNVK